MARLILLNGPPGVGKSTLARRYVAEHPGALNCDVDILRTLIGGWQDNFSRAGELIRPAALAMIGAYLKNGQDVILPQLLLDPAELAKFEACALEVGAQFVECLLVDAGDTAVARFRRRGHGDQDAWHTQVQSIVEQLGGDDYLARINSDLHELASTRPGLITITSVENHLDDTYRAFVTALS